ncbi:MAG TPA: hypothetical protein VKZ53_13250 [Candidatus Angelobacter sp.]|nr:hypothetical protein [Candidatus Angelobacter sp.]
MFWPTAFAFSLLSISLLVNSTSIHSTDIHSTSINPAGINPIRSAPNDPNQQATNRKGRESAVTEGSAATERTLKIASRGEQPGYTLRVSTRGREGVVEVQDDASVLVETLTCPLLREMRAPSAAEIQAASERFVDGFEIEDLDLDGALDLKGPREFGAKWARYCVWLYEPKTHRFSGSYGKDLLIEQMELLYSLKADPKRQRVISYSIGPVDPMWDEYKIEGLGANRPYWPRLVPTKSCLIQASLIQTSLIQTNSQGTEATAVITQYEERPNVIRRKLNPKDTRSVEEICHD